MRVEATGLAATVRPGREAMSATLGADQISLDARQLRERVERLEAELRIAQTRVEIRRLAAAWEKRRVTVEGRVDGPFDEPRLDLTARGDVDLSAVGTRAERRT